MIISLYAKHVYDDMEVLLSEVNNVFEDIVERTIYANPEEYFGRFYDV